MAADEAQKLFKVVEFYSGVGGMHYALLLSKISSEVVAAVDINEIANKVYRHNFPDINLLQRNIQSVTLKDFSRWNADIFLMSPPCQPFTRVGLKGDKNDPRTSSFLYLLQTLPNGPIPDVDTVTAGQLEDAMADQGAAMAVSNEGKAVYCRWVSQFFGGIMATREGTDGNCRLCRWLSEKPRYLLVENVKGFETSHTRNELVDTLKKCNYKYKEFLLSPKDLGIPNQRLRYFLIAKHDTLKFHGDIQFNNGDTLLSHEISSEDNGCHSPDVGFTRGCMERMKESDEASLKLGDSTTNGDSFHIINDSSCRNDSTTSETDHCHVNVLEEETHYFLQSQKDKSFINMSDLLCGSGSIKDYLENLSEKEFEDHLVPEKVLVRFGKVMDIVQDSDERTCCFTKAYGHYVEGTGSFLQTNPSVTKHWAFEHQEESEQTISRLKQLCLRYFTPREIANFHHFPHDFTFPSDVSHKQQYRLLGNSLNACVVAVLLRYLVYSQDAT